MTTYEDYGALLIERTGRLLTVTINRPEARNAINKQLHDELGRIFFDIDADSEVDIAILTGGSGAFCAGGDLNWLLSIQGQPVATADILRNDRRIQSSMLELEKPLIAKVRGPAIGLGCSLALFCDLIYATPDSRFADPHVSVGLVAGDGGALIWPQLIGYARAKRYLLTGDPISGAEAAELGLITEAVSEDELDATVQAMAERLLGGARYSIRWTKSSINAGLRLMATSILDRSAAFENISQLMDDHRIALEAMQERTRPVFTGR
jgi:enoyl-CoA hydratase